MKVEMQSTVDVDLLLLARVFASMNDDEQAQFFVEVAKIMATWTPGAAEMQIHYIGSHLRNCKCSTEEARELIRGIAYAIEHGKHGEEAAA
jgi:hypothetical protein